MKTHEVTNQVPELKDYNVFASDLALTAGVQREQAQWHASALSGLAIELGSAGYAATWGAGQPLPS